MKNLTAYLKLTLIVLASMALISSIIYVGYSIYKAKYPNTTVWMYILDTKK